MHSSWNCTPHWIVSLASWNAWIRSYCQKIQFWATKGILFQWILCRIHRKGSFWLGKCKRWRYSDEGIDHGFNITQLYDGLQEGFDNYDKWFNKKNPGVDPMATGLTYNDYRGRTYVLLEYYHPTAWVGRSAVEFIQWYNRSQTFLLKVSFHWPHSPYDPPGRWMNYFKPQDMPAAYVGGNWDESYCMCICTALRMYI